MSTEDELVIECVRALQAAAAHPGARRQVQLYLLRQGWTAAPEVIDLTTEHRRRDGAPVPSRSEGD